MTEVTTSRQRT